MSESFKRFRGRMVLPRKGEEEDKSLFDPNRPKLNLDDIRERVRGRYVLYLPQLQLLMDAYDSVLKVAPSGLRKELVRNLENRANQIAVEGWDSRPRWTDRTPGPSRPY